MSIKDLDGAELIERVRRKVQSAGQSGTDKNVADYLGITVQAVFNYKHKNLTTRSVVGLLDKIAKRSALQTEALAISPIVEFLKIAPCKTRNGGGLEIFSVRLDGEPHPYMQGLRAELESHHGIYVFYDSRGRALYSGKARRQSLWREINLAFNRDRNSVQKIKRVDHPVRRQDFRTSDELRRQIRQRAVSLSDLASYVSAYKVADGLINDLESLLIRAFPNDLLNVKVEKFRAPPKTLRR